MTDSRILFPQRRYLGTVQTNVIPQALSYTGPGNIQGGARAVWSTRAYQQSQIGQNIIKLRRDSDNATSDFATISGGGLDVSAIASFKGAANLFVDTMYDQSPNGLNLVQATTAKQFAFILNGLGTLPVLRGNAAGSTHMTVSASLASPFSLHMVAKRTANFTTTQTFCADDALDVNLTYKGAVNTVTIGGTSSFDATASDSAYHTIEAVIDGASSKIGVDGAETSGNAGTGGLTSGTIGIGAWPAFGGAQACDFDAVEFILYPASISSTIVTQLNNNSHAYWGY